MKILQHESFPDLWYIFVSVASFPGSAQLSTASSLEKWKGPGIISPMSDVERREDLIEHKWNVNVSTHVVVQSTVHVAVFGRSLVSQLFLVKPFSGLVCQLHKAVTMIFECTGVRVLTMACHTTR